MGKGVIGIVLRTSIFMQTVFSILLVEMAIPGVFATAFIFLQLINIAIQQTTFTAIDGNIMSTSEIRPDIPNTAVRVVLTANKITTLYDDHFKDLAACKSLSSLGIKSDTYSSTLSFQRSQWYMVG